MSAFIRNKPYHGPVRAVVLDWSGTVVDHGSMTPVAAMLTLFRKHGISLSPIEVREPMGLDKRSHLSTLLSSPTTQEHWREIHGYMPNQDDVETLFWELQSLLEKALGRVNLIDGALPAVEEFRQRGLVIGTTTGFTKHMMQVLSQRARKLGFTPDSVVSSSDVSRGRPYPWMCFLNAIELQVYPMEAIVKIGDTIHDIHEGLNAGMWTIGISRTGNELGLTSSQVQKIDRKVLQSRLSHIEQKFLAAGAHYVAESLSQCPYIIDEINLRLAQGELPCESKLSP